MKNVGGPAAKRGRRSQGVFHRPSELNQDFETLPFLGDRHHGGRAPGQPLHHHVRAGPSLSAPLLRAKPAHPRAGEGEFFGEISLLGGEPRTATITASLRAELLELDRARLDSIARRHPRVREVLQQFHDERKNNSLEATIRGMEIA
jgi:CRP-like cAMP-binding protein